MRRFLIALLMTCVVASLQAITINWHLKDVQANEDGTGGKSWNLTQSSVVYFVYSQSDNLSETDLAKGTYTAYNGYNIGYKSVKDANGKESYITAATQIGSGATDTTIDGVDMSTFGSYASLTIDGTVAAGYFYLVVFNPANDPTKQGNYLVSNAMAYTPGTTDSDGDKISDNNENGIYDTTVDGERPEIGDFVDITWMGSAMGPSPIVPEPTALALLALGVAGLALRRKI